MRVSYSPLVSRLHATETPPDAPEGSRTLAGFRWAFDIGTGSRCVLLAIQKWAPEHYHVSHEFHGSEHSVISLMSEARRRLPYMPTEIVMGHDGLKRDPLTGHRITDYLRANLAPVHALRLDFAESITRLRAQLLTPTLPAGVSIHPRCVRLLYDLSRYSLRIVNENRIMATRHKFSHTVDALRYGATRVYTPNKAA